MPIHTVRLLRKEVVAEGTMAFHVEKPDGFTFKAGQFADVTLIDPAETDAEGNTRAFSIASAPHEETLMFATRMRDTAFKRVLGKMESGTDLHIDAPHGSFTLHNHAETPAVFLTGGIGITPVRSIVLHAQHERLPHRITLFYSNNRPEDAAFLDEVAAAQDANPNGTFVGTMSAMERSAREWQGETGYITPEMLGKAIDDMTRPIYYLDGPPAMVAAMRKLLEAAGVDEDNIRTEEFSGY
ncbi:MAG: FAD-dependent oxidoreductase [Gemmatimonadota bacterium]